MRWHIHLAGLLALAGVSAHAGAVEVAFEPGPDVQMAVQEAFILAEPGTVFTFAPGSYTFTMQLSLDVDRVTVRGAGMDETVFSFADQDMGSEGLYVTGDRVTLEDFAVEDTKGNAIKANGMRNLVMRRLRTEWTNGPDEKNGAYGLYPVSSEQVLIEGCVAIGASDAGIYVGQSRHIVVRDSRAEYNVAGIEIENCYHADVHGNTAVNNTGGILVFDLPGLPQQGGRDVRVFGNRVTGNNTANFAPAGNIVAKVPAGTGIMVMANQNVELFGNTVGGHQTTNLVIASYLATGIPVVDPDYYPYPENIHVHGNTFGRAGYEPAGELGAMAALVAGTPLPHVLWDGIVNPQKRAAGDIPANANIRIHGNTAESGELTFANLNIDAGGPVLLPGIVLRDLTAHAGALPPVEPVALEGMEP